MNRFRPRRNQPRAWLGVFGVSALVTVMVAGASTATAAHTSLEGEAFAISLNSSLLGQVIPPTPLVEGTAGHPVDGFDLSETSVGVNVLNLVGAAVLNAETVGSDANSTSEFANVESFASAANVAIGVGITLGAVEADCRAESSGAIPEGSARLVNAFVGTTPLTISTGPTQLQIPGILNIILNERTVNRQQTGAVNDFAEIELNAVRIQLLTTLDTPLGDLIGDVPVLGVLLEGLLGTGGGGGDLGGLLGSLPLVGDLLDGLTDTDLVEDLFGDSGIDLGDLLLGGLFNGTPLIDLTVGHVFCRAQGPNVVAPTTTTAAPTTTTAAPTTTTTGPVTTTTAAPTTTTTGPAPTTTTAAPTTTTAAVPGATTTTEPKVLSMTGSETRPLTVFAIVSSVLGTLLWFGGTPESAGPGGPRRRRRFSV